MGGHNWIEKMICEEGATRIPSNLKIEEDGDAVRITLNADKIQKRNMQESGNDFEGWAIASRVCTNREIVLCTDKSLAIQKSSFIGMGHLSRFLYRIMKFSEQYKWFHLSEDLQKDVSVFKEYLQSGQFTNNIGTGEAGNKNKYDDENAVEAKMAEDGVLRKVIKGIDIGNGKVYRQLSVGLFEGTVSRYNAVFTGGKSAIDLWSRDGDSINVVELKTNNPMMGIVTEIFFYSNYIFDLVRPNGLFSLNEPTKRKKGHRGYEEIWNNREQLRKVNGIMLADEGKFHPWVEKCSSILNDNNTDELNYYVENYHLEVIVE